jgi:hypothetical protein
MRARVIVFDFVILEESDFSGCFVLVLVENVIAVFPYIFGVRAKSCESAGYMVLSLIAVDGSGFSRMDGSSTSP